VVNPGPGGAPLLLEACLAIAPDSPSFPVIAGRVSQPIGGAFLIGGAHGLWAFLIGGVHGLSPCFLLFESE